MLVTNPKLVQCTIEQATLNDGPAVAQVFRQSFITALPNFPVLHSEEEDREFFTRAIQNEKVFVACDENGKVIGFIGFNQQWVNHLWLLPQYQRQGIGKRLLDIAKKHCSKIDLWTFQVNENARNFYRKNGFVEIKETDGSDNEENQPDVLLEWNSRG